MNLFWEEWRKILKKGIVWIFTAGLFAFLGIYIFSDLHAAHITCDGRHYWGWEAVQKDREIAKEWEGTLTMEKLYRILDTYGAAVMEQDEAGWTRSGNWASRYATNRLTDYMQGGNGVLRKEEELEWFADKLEKYKPSFTYLNGFDSVLMEGGLMGNIGVLLIIIIALAPVFAEEYSLNTASLLFTGVHGRKKDVKAKILAAMVFAGLLFLLVNGFLFLLFFVLYGGEGLNAGSCLSMNIEWDSAFTCGEVWLHNLGWGLLGVLMMAAVTLFFSAICKSSFPALIWPLVFLAAGYALAKAVSFMPYHILSVLCIVLGKWGPLCLTMNDRLGVLDWEMPWQLLYVPGVTALFAFLGQHFYKRHEC